MNNSDSNKPLSSNSSETQIREMVELLDANKAEDIVTINLEPAMGYEFWFVIVSALSQAHLRKLSDELSHLMKKLGDLPGRKPDSSDYESGWVILDYGNIVIHFFMPEKREFYKLERLWEKCHIKHWSDEEIDSARE